MQSLNSIVNTVEAEPAVMLYFSAPSCNVCQALKPKLFRAIETEFDAFEIISIDISESPEIASHFSVFAIPTLIAFLEGREFLRKSRHMSVGEVVEVIRRPYEILFA